MTSSNERESISYRLPENRNEDEEAFEMIPPLINSSNAPNDQRRKTVVDSSRTASTRKSAHLKTRRLSSESIVWITIAIAAVTGAAVFSYGRGTARNQIEELRSEFKNELKSFRFEIEREFGVHSLATAAVKTARDEREMIDTSVDTETEKTYSGVLNSAPTGHVSSTMKSKLLLDDSPLLPVCNSHADLGDASYCRDDDRLQAATFVSCLGWIGDEILCKLRSMDFTTISSSLGWIQDTILHRLQVIDVTARTFWFWVKNGILHKLRAIDVASIRNTIVHRVTNLVDQRPFLFWGLLFAFLLALYVCYRSDADRPHERDITNTAQNASNPAQDGNDSDESDEDSHALNSQYPSERHEDVLMENMFHDAMTSTANPPVTPRKNIDGKIKVYRRPLAANSSRSAPSSGHGGTISKAERKRRARINAKVFGARDKQRLSLGSKASIRNTSPPADVARTEPAPSPWASKRARLAQARTNANLFAEQDRQRVEKALADDLWKKRRGNRRRM